MTNANDASGPFATDGARRAGLDALERDATPSRAMDFFDALPAVQLGEMIGAWRGAELVTGHPLNGLLGRFRWYGKRFDGPEQVHPLVMGRPGALFCIDPALLPLQFARRHAGLVKCWPVSALARPALRALATREPKARLRMTEFRGVVSATMIYDALPVNDVFRRIDADTLLGAMDLRGDVPPELFFFVLRRER